MTRIRKAATATVVNQAFLWTSLVLSLVTVPLYLGWLGNERYGLYLTGVAFSSFLMFSDAGVNWASILLIGQANGREDRSGIATIVRVSFPLAVASSLVVAGAIAAALFVLGQTNDWISLVPRHPELPGLLLAIGASVVVLLLVSPFYNLLIGLQEASLAGIYQGSGRLFGTLASIAIASTGASLGWVYTGGLVGAALAGTGAAIHAARRHPWAFVKGPFFDREAVGVQLRTGMKSLVMQSGMVLWGTSAVFAISLGAGPQFVPAFSVPMTILNAPLGVIHAFSASLQPAYGEAIGRGEKQWIAGTVGQILRRSMLLIGLIGCGFILLAQPFIDWWTAGKLPVSGAMLGSVLAIAIVNTVLTVLRYAVTGINRHRTAALADLLSGVLAIGFGIAVVSMIGPEAIGVAVAGAAVLTTGWILPRELSSALGHVKLGVGVGFWSRMILVTILVTGVGSYCLSIFSESQGLVLILPAFVGIIAVYAVLVATVLPGDWALIREFATAAVGKLKRSNP